MIDELNPMSEMTKTPPIPASQVSEPMTIKEDVVQKDAPSPTNVQLNFSGLEPLPLAVENGGSGLSSQLTEPAETKPVPAENQDDVTLNELKEKQAYWDRVLTGNLETVPVELKEAIGVSSHEDLLGQQHLAGNIMRSWAVDHKNLSQEEVQANWNQHREKLAIEYESGDDDYELFLAVSERNKVKTQEKALIHDLYQNALELGLGGAKSEENTPEPLKEKLNKLPAHLKSSAYDVVSQAMLYGRNERTRLAQDVDLLWKGMQFFLAGETPPEKYKQGTDPQSIEYREGYMTRLRLYAPHMDKAVARLDKMDEDDKAKVYFLLKEKKCIVNLLDA